jgi:hypothetical protein
MTGQFGSGCPAAARGSDATPSTRASSARTSSDLDDAEILVLERGEILVLEEEKAPAVRAADAAPSLRAMRATQAILVVWSLATTVVAFSAWHSRAKTPLLSATFALTALSLLKE